MRFASIFLIGIGVLFPLAPNAHSQGSALQGIAFAVDTTPELTPQGPGPVRPLGLQVTWAGTRGRIDVLTRPARPVIKLGDVIAGPSLAMPGDYYLFDSTGFVLVRPATKQYSIMQISDAAFNYEGRRDGWPAFFRFAPIRVDTIPANAAATNEHGEHPIYWHVDIAKDTVCGLGGCSVEELARGRSTIADAPLAELIVARWFGPAQALAEIPGGVSRLLDKPIRVTTVSPMTGVHRLRDLRPASVSPGFCRSTVARFPFKHGQRRRGSRRQVARASNKPVTIFRASARRSLTILQLNWGSAGPGSCVIQSLLVDDGNEGVTRPGQEQNIRADRR